MFVGVQILQEPMGGPATLRELLCLRPAAFNRQRPSLRHAVSITCALLPCLLATGVVLARVLKVISYSSLYWNWQFCTLSAQPHMRAGILPPRLAAC